MIHIILMWFLDPVFGVGFTIRLNKSHNRQKRNKSIHNRLKYSFIQSENSYRAPLCAKDDSRHHGCMTQVNLILTELTVWHLVYIFPVSVMINFMCQLDCTTVCPENWTNLLGMSMQKLASS